MVLPPIPEVMYHTDGTLVGDTARTPRPGDAALPATSHAPFPGDNTFASPCSCFMYGVCPVPPVSEGWDRMAGEAVGKAEDDKRLDEARLPPDYIYHYPPSTYFPFSHMHTAPPPPLPLPAAPPATGTGPVILLSPPSSSPPAMTASPTPIPNTLTNMSNDKGEPLETNSIVAITKACKEISLQCPPPSSPPSVPLPHHNPAVLPHHNPALPHHSPALPHHSPALPHHSPYAHPLMEEAKKGVFGPDGCWYSLSSAQNHTGEEHPLALPPSALNPSVYYPYMHPYHTILVSPHDPYPPTLLPSFHNSIHSSPASNSLSTLTSSPSSSSSIASSLPPPAPPASSAQGSHLIKQNGAGREGFVYYNCFQHLNIPVDVFGRPRLLNSVKKDGKASVEDLWTSHMNSLFHNLPDPWVLAAAQPDRKMTINWFTFRDLAKVRFFCKKCNDGWTSMYGVVVFHYRWNKNLHHGQILYKVAGQKCAGVCTSEGFEMPLWYPEEAQKVITNVYYKIAAQFYKLVTPQYIRTRRFGKPATHHNRDLCEGCQQGVCKMDPGAFVTKE